MGRVVVGRWSWPTSPRPDSKSQLSLITRQEMTHRKSYAGQEKRIRAPAFHGSLGMHIRLAPLGSDFDSYSNSRRHLPQASLELLCGIVTNSIFYDADLVSARLKPSSATVCAMNIVIGVQVFVWMSDSTDPSRPFLQYRLRSKINDKNL